MIIETEVQTLPKEMNHFFLKDEKKNNKGVSINTTIGFRQHLCKIEHCVAGRWWDVDDISRVLTESEKKT